MHRKALGKGLEALFGADAREDSHQFESGDTVRRIINVPIQDIIPNRNQPREVFADDAMNDLKRSIAENGIIEPPVVRRNGDFFELIAGERRYRAARELKYETIDVILADIESDDKVLVLSLVENIQRQDLNAIEEAKAYRKIMDSMEITQEKTAEIVGKSRSTVANLLRLLSLPDHIQSMVSESMLAPGSARALITIQDKELQLALAKKISAENLSARKAEQLVKHELAKATVAPVTKSLSPYLQEIKENIQRVFGTDIKLKGGDTKGKIEISYYSRADLERILDTMKSNL